MSTQATPVPRVSPSPPCATDGRAPWALALARSPLRRGVGVLLVAGSLGYLGWLIATLNHTYWWLAWPFMVANLALVTLLLVSLINNWSRSPLRDPPPPQPPTEFPLVAVLVPTVNEPAWMLARTLRSVLDQHWPHHRLVLVVGDDGHRAPIRDLARELAAEYPDVVVHYVRPPRPGSPDRRGAAKAGNLNAMLDLVVAHHPEVAYVETRDADDLAADPYFLRHTVDVLEREPDVAYVQTIKDALVSPGDPFGNRRTFFYRGIMLSRDAGGATFPCGSGLVWRREALQAIGGFPTWNLVEDLYSGYLALQHGYRGRYLPVVGALAQTAPEDIPNVYQQLGTWALDTLRIFFWRPPWRVRGLTWRQRLHFTEMGLFYLSALPTVVLMLVPAACLLLDVRVLRVDPLQHALLSWGYTTLITVFTFLLGNGTPWREMMRAKQVWVGLVFVYLRSAWRALRHGPDRKPAYRPTRKVRRPGVYLWHVAPHLTVLTLLAGAVGYHVASHLPGDPLAMDLGSLFWVTFYSGMLLGFIRRSWYGVGAS